MSKIPDLIERLRDIHESQLIEIRGALNRRGNLELSDRAKHPRVMHNLWVELTDEQRRKVHNTFLRFCPSVGAFQSTDGHLTVPITACLAKKTWPDKAVKKL